MQGIPTGGAFVVQGLLILVIGSVFVVQGILPGGVFVVQGLLTGSVFVVQGIPAGSVFVVQGIQVAARTRTAAGCYPSQRCGIQIWADCQQV